jgi:hypothetical protein
VVKDHKGSKAVNVQRIAQVGREAASPVDDSTDVVEAPPSSKELIEEDA